MVVFVSVPPLPIARMPQARKFSLMLSASNFEYSAVEVELEPVARAELDSDIAAGRTRSCWNSAEPMSEGASTLVTPGPGSVSTGK